MCEPDSSIRERLCRSLSSALSWRYRGGQLREVRCHFHPAPSPSHPSCCASTLGGSASMPQPKPFTMDAAPKRGRSARHPAPDSTRKNVSSNGTHPFIPPPTREQLMAGSAKLRRVYKVEAYPPLRNSTRRRLPRAGEAPDRGSGRPGGEIAIARAYASSPAHHYIDAPGHTLGLSLWTSGR
jgi:hypothetical protein